MSTVMDESKLLALPMELLQRVTNSVEDEVLITLRLTCKTLQTATLDRFAECYCERRACFALSVDRWEHLRAILTISPQLARKMRHVALTTDIWEDCGRSKLQLAPEERFADIREAQHEAYKEANKADALLLDSGSSSRPDADLMVTILYELQRRNKHLFARVVAVAFHEAQFKKSTLYRDILVAVAATRLRLDHLIISYACIAGLETFLFLLGSKFLYCTSSIRQFDFQRDHFSILPDEPFEQPRLDFVRDILSSATNLSRLYVDLRHFVQEQQHHLTPYIARDSLSVIASHALSHLTLCNLDILGVDFHRELASYKSTLQHLQLSRVILRCDAHEWMGVFQLLSDAPELEYLQFCLLCVEPADRGSGPAMFVSLEHYKHSKKILNEGHENLVLNGRQEVVAGVGELLSKPLVYKRYDS